MRTIRAMSAVKAMQSRSVKAGKDCMNLQEINAEIQSERFEKNFLEKKLIVRKEKIFVACSGGPDSVALLDLFVSLRKKYRLKLGILFFDHGLRKASIKEQRFVKKLAKKYRVPFYAGKAQTKKIAVNEKFSLEEAARKARYAFFEKIAKQKKIYKIATAHHLNDQAETILMRVIQGTGLRGLCGIREKNRQGKLTYIRPLLPFTKKEILDYLKSKRLSFCQDQSNQSSKFFRNRLRLELLPELEKKYNPRILHSLSRIAEIASKEEETLSSLEERSWKRCFQKKKGKTVLFRRPFFLQLPPSLQFRLIEKGLKVLNPKSGLNFEAWEKISPHFGQKSFRHSLPKDIDFILTPSEIMLYSKK